METENTITPRRRVARVVYSLGGSTTLGRVLDIHPSTVRKWVDKDRIPAQHQRRLLDLARASGVALDAEDLIG